MLDRAASRSWFLAYALLGLGTLALYASTAAPGLLWGDSGELQMAALCGGIPHATGYPLFMMIGRLFGSLPWGDPAYRINLMSAAFGAAGIVCFARLLRELGVRPTAAVLGASAYALSFTYWRVSQRGEVYTLSLLIAIAAISWTCVALRSRRLADALGAGFLLGLTLTGHMGYALLVAALGLSLAWSIARSHANPLPAALALAAAFVVGLTPYLYLVIADGQTLPYNYLRLVELVQNPLGPPDPAFDTSRERVWWLITGRNEYPPQPIVFNVVQTVRGLIDSALDVFLIELGPLSLPLAWLGMRRLRQAGRPEVWPLVVGALLVAVLAASITGGGLLPIYLLPTVLVAAILCAVGIDAALERASRMATGAVARVGIAIAFLVALVLPGHLVRLASYDHPIGPTRFTVLEEESGMRTGLVPTMRGFTDPIRFADAAVERIPRDALVVAGWSEFPVLLYVQLVEGRRPDLTVEPISRVSLGVRLERWAKAHDLGRRPIVFLGPNGETRDFFTGTDSVQVLNARWAYVQHSPIVVRASKGSNP